MEVAMDMVILGIKKKIVQNWEDTIRQIMVHPVDLIEITIIMENDVIGERTVRNSRTNIKERENWKW